MVVSGKGLQLPLLIAWASLLSVLIFYNLLFKDCKVDITFLDPRAVSPDHGNVLIDEEELTGLGHMREDILYFNRVPKTGSENFVTLLQALQHWNGSQNFHHVRFPSPQPRRISKKVQVILLFRGRENGNCRCLSLRSELPPF